jgi:DivIVA domain-containing protein
VARTEILAALLEGPADTRFNKTTRAVPRSLRVGRVGASTTFSSTGLGFGYDKREVDVFRSAVRDTFLGGAVFWVSTPPVKSDDVHGKQFSTHRRGYDKKQVAAFLEAAAIRLAAMESMDRQNDHWLAVPFSPNGPRGPTQQDFPPPPPVRGLRDGGGGRLPERAA